MTANLFDRSELRAARSLLAEGDASDAADVLARAAWSGLTEPGDAVAATLIEAVGATAALAHVVSSATASDVLADSDCTPGELSALATGLERWRPRLDRALVLRRIDIAQKLKAHLLLPGSPGWPEALDDLGPHAPLILWSRGDPSAFAPAHRLALVGARAATGYGEHVTAELAAGVADRGVLVVSGGAFGIDAVGHRAVLGSGGRTVAFLAGGPDRLYPTAHSELLHRIIATPGCAVVTEVPPGTTPTRWRFLQRNRLIAASSGATVIVEAGARSGSLNTAGHAAALGRPLGAVPGPVTSASSAGCHRLLREFAATCVSTAPEVLELLGVGESVPADLVPGPASRLVAALRERGQQDTDALAQHLGLRVSETLAILGALLAEAHVQRSDDGRWSVTPR
ncbi:DNA-processing protein DprA [Rathayibacter sp. Leaf248]|uniref:DNA-processing protein DprA n=1 Tax=Rathayibacter sp. Leaf248 TaxID=2876555 RepID=UPI001E4E229E|nr:DNA-processing protein DprA [Rathayibacter sp. Leaf248]